MVLAKSVVSWSKRLGEIYRLGWEAKLFVEIMEAVKSPWCPGRVLHSLGRSLILGLLILKSRLEKERRHLNPPQERLDCCLTNSSFF
jgi:hypothetical protein